MRGPKKIQIRDAQKPKSIEFNKKGTPSDPPDPFFLGLPRQGSL